jgi:hypothetical protein
MLTVPEMVVETSSVHDFHFSTSISGYIRKWICITTTLLPEPMFDIAVGHKATQVE